MKILFTASEVAPFIKTGGLADVAGSLPQALAAQGHQVRVVLPLYEGIGAQWRDNMEFLFHFDVWVSWRNSYCGVFSLEQDGVTYYFIDNEYYFKRGRIYGHFDDCERFAFFCQAVMSLPDRLDWAPDILHANDWQTALIPIYLLEQKYHRPMLANAASVFTIHNIEYQGRYGTSVLLDVLGLNESYFNSNMLEYYGDINLMKGAILSADYITTVSPTYAMELTIPFYAHGLHDVIASQSHKLSGILNGIDTQIYNAAKDPALAQNFALGTLDQGKPKCKDALQSAFGLKKDPHVPIIACISRLVEHKGFALVVHALEQILSLDVQMVVLGTGSYEFEEAFRQAEGRYPGRFVAKISYSPTLSNLIYAGADLFLMPSISEPCGLSQMISMQYATVPIVRETGGLQDSVSPFLMDQGTGVGFTFTNINAHDMLFVIEEAVNLYKNNQTSWKILMENAMREDFSWDKSAGKYGQIYQDVKKAQEEAAAFALAQQKEREKQAKLAEKEKAAQAKADQEKADEAEPAPVQKASEKSGTSSKSPGKKPKKGKKK